MSCIPMAAAARALALGALALATLDVGAAGASVLLMDSYSQWLAAAGGPAIVTSSLGKPAGDEIPMMTAIDLDAGGSLSASHPLGVAAIGDGWATWSGGYAGEVLVSEYSSLTVNVSGVGDLGFYAEPDQYKSLQILVHLADGQQVSEQVNGDGGARFFGFVGAGVQRLTISTADPEGFAFGEFVQSAVPEPAAWTLMIAGFGGIGGALRRRRRSATATA